MRACMCVLEFVRMALVIIKMYIKNLFIPYA